MSKEIWEKQLQRLFEGFEPDVPVSRFEDLEPELQNIDVKRNLIQQAQFARRLAVGATVVAVGALGWTSVRFVETETEDVSELTTVVADFEQSVAEGTESHASVMTSALSKDVETSGGAARTTTKFRIDSDLVDESDASADETSLDASTGSGDSQTATTSLIPHAKRGDEWNDKVAGEHLEHAENEPAIENEDHAPRDERAADVFVDLASSVQEACEGTEVSFSLGQTEMQGSVLWNFGDGNFSNYPSPTHIFKSPGTYDITISLRSRNDGVIRTRTVENMIVVRPKPEAQLTWDAHFDRDNGDLVVHYNDLTESTSSSTWFVDGKILDRGEQRFDDKGEHVVQLVASNAYGCQDTDEKKVEIGDRKKAKAPALFSPDGDGRYDTFLPAVVHETNDGWTLQIVDEDGQEIFATSRADQPWRGELMNGELAPAGMFYKWLLTVKQRHRLPEFYFDKVRIER
ncbi:MAG: PKD domain-containing protein [Flavobacteriales bacterium]